MRWPERRWRRSELERAEALARGLRERARKARIASQDAHPVAAAALRGKCVAYHEAADMVLAMARTGRVRKKWKEPDA